MNQSFPLNRSRDVASTWPTHPRWLCPETTTLPPTNIAIFINWTQTKWLPNQLTWINFCYFFSLSFSFFFFFIYSVFPPQNYFETNEIIGGEKKNTGNVTELIPKMAVACEAPPLYLRLRMGKPLVRKPGMNTPIVSYGKKKMKPEYWFSIPRDKWVDFNMQMWLFNPSSRNLREQLPDTSTARNTQMLFKYLIVNCVYITFTLSSTKFNFCS